MKIKLYTFLQEQQRQTLTSKMIVIVGSSCIDATHTVQQVIVLLEKWPYAVMDRSLICNLSISPEDACLLPELNEEQLSRRSPTQLPEQLFRVPVLSFMSNFKSN